MSNIQRRHASGKGIKLSCCLICKGTMTFTVTPIVTEDQLFKQLGIVQPVSGLRMKKIVGPFNTTTDLTLYQTTQTER